MSRFPNFVYFHFNFFFLPGNLEWDGKLEDSTQTFGISGFQEPQTV